MAAWRIFEEGFQPPHPASFSYHHHEVDLGYGACVPLQKRALIPRPPREEAMETRAHS